MKFLLFSKLSEVSSHEHFKRWVPPPPDPPPMTAAEEVATSKRLENPPLCGCRGVAEVDSSEGVREFRCANKNKVSNPTLPLIHWFAVSSIQIY